MQFFQKGFFWGFFYKKDFFPGLKQVKCVAFKGHGGLIWAPPLKFCAQNKAESVYLMIQYVKMQIFFKKVDFWGPIYQKGCRSAL